MEPMCLAVMKALVSTALKLIIWSIANRVRAKTTSTFRFHHFSALEPTQYSQVADTISHVLVDAHSIDPIQEIEPKVGGGCCLEGGSSFATLLYHILKTSVLYIGDNYQFGLGL